MCVVQVALVLIVQDIVGLLHSFEFDFSRFPLRFGDLIRMARESCLFEKKKERKKLLASALLDGWCRPHFAVSLADIFFRGVAFNAEDLWYTQALAEADLNQSLSKNSTVEVDLSGFVHCRVLLAICKRRLVAG